MSGNKSKLSLYLLALPALAMSVSSAFADPVSGPSGKLTVTGQYTPPPCNVTLAANGTIDYGHISSSSLSSLYETTLPIKTLANAITINCAAATSVAINWEDNRFSSLSGSPIDTVGLYNQLQPSGSTSVVGLYLGLGNDSGNHPIGSYVSTLSALKVDGSPQFFASDATVPFQKGSATPTDVFEYMGNRGPSLAYNFLNTDGDPVKGKLFTMDYNVMATIVKSTLLDFSQQVTLDGSSTISLYYL